MNRSINLYFAIGATAFTGIVVALLIALAFPAQDDWVYMTVPPGTTDGFWCLQGEHLSHPGSILPAAWRHWLLINGRLANILAFPLLMLPRWLQGIVCGLFAAAMLWGIFRASGKVPQAWLCALAALVIWKWFPWYDLYLSADYMTNYLWSCTVALWAALPALRKKLPAWAPAVAFVAGWMHEGFALPLLCGCAFLTLIWWRRGELTPLRVVFIAALIAGTLLNVLAPSTWLRIAERRSLPQSTAGASFTLTLPVALTLILALWRLIQWRRLSVTDTFWWICFGAALAMCIFLSNIARLHWWTDVCSAVLLLRAAATLRRPRRGLAALCGALALCWGIAATVTQWRIRQAVAPALEALSSPQTQNVYADLPQTTAIPRWLWGIPQSPFQNFIPMLQCMRYLHREMDYPRVCGLFPRAGTVEMPGTARLIGTTDLQWSRLKPQPFTPVRLRFDDGSSAAASVHLLTEGYTVEGSDTIYVVGLSPSPAAFRKQLVGADLE